jgi:hypothetical protein
VKKRGESQTDKREGPPYRVRLPGFLIEDEVGLGDHQKGDFRHEDQSLWRL